MMTRDIERSCECRSLNIHDTTSQLAAAQAEVRVSQKGRDVSVRVRPWHLCRAKRLESTRGSLASARIVWSEDSDVEAIWC